VDKQQLEEIGGRLRQRRTSLGFTREQIAELADVGVGYYGQLEVGTSQMSIDTLVKISKSMKLPMEFILFGTGFEAGDSTPIIEILRNCTKRELKLAEKVLKLFLLKSD
jgi:transcriptional regulator with XRE-family HTH domain